MKRLSFKLAIAACLLLFIIPNHSHAQALGHTYKTGVGVKLGWGGAALDVKHFLKPNGAIEGMLSFGHHWFTITGLYEYHGPISDAPGLQYYAGGGAHLGFWNYPDNTSPYSSSAFGGIDGILGLDYKFNKAPIDLSFDIQPAINFPDGGFDVWGGLSVRFAF